VDWSVDGALRTVPVFFEEIAKGSSECDEGRLSIRTKLMLRGKPEIFVFARTHAQRQYAGESRQWVLQLTAHFLASSIIFQSPILGENSER
jgi:hypothetical protein